MMDLLDMNLIVSNSPRFGADGWRERKTWLSARREWTDWTDWTGGYVPVEIVP